MTLGSLTGSAQNIFLEDFDACELPAGWSNTSVLGDTIWTIGDNASGTPGGSVDGSCMAFVHDDDLGSAFGAIIMDLETPVIDLSAQDTGLLQFDYIFEDIGASYFAVALWNGATWDTVFTENTDPGCMGFFPTCGPRSASIDLSGYLNADFQAKFIYDDGDGWNWYIGLDNVAIYVPPTDDGDLVAMINPSTGCGLSATEPVGFSVFNNGQSTITSIDISYSVNGNPVVSETFVSDILSAETDTFDLLSTVDLATPGTYTIQAWITVAGDPDAENDTIVSTLESIPVISSLPYMQDFEAGADGWTTGGDFSTWELGDPETAFIDTAASGINAWVTNLDGFYNVNELSYVESPCFDFSAFTVDPVFRFAFIANAEPNYDGTRFEVSLDAGLTWAAVGNVGEGTNWYDNDAFFNANIPQGWNEPVSGANEYTTATHLIDGAAGESSVKLRVSFVSDGSVNGFDGFAFDDIEIFEQPSINAGVTEVLSPVTGCGLGIELVTVVVENFGDADLVDFNVEYNLGAGIITELIADTLFAASVDTFTFAVPVDLSVTGDYDFGSWTAIVGDGDVLNDSLFSSITSIPVVSSLPYLADFESGSGGWYSNGVNGVWELGDPEGILIDTANSGVNAWATNLDSIAYNVNQLSYLTSPCFDMSGILIDPIFEFALISNSEANWDGTWLEVSTNAGTTWRTVGNVGEGTNWYNNEDEHGTNFDLDWWDGLTTDSTWVTSKHLLDSVAGYSNVIVRFVFESDASDFADWEGFAIDDISLTEQPPVNSELTAVVSPETSCGLTAAESVQVTVTNLGSLDMDSVILGFSLDNGSAFSEVFNDTLSPNESGTYTFSQTVDLSTPADYNLSVWVSAIGDGDTGNDTLSTIITNVPILSSFPYLIDFESGTNGWTSGGVENVWELGDPESVFIDTANSGVNAWVTVLNGDYPNLGNDTTYVESPCLDFTSFTGDPVLSFAGIFETESCCDEGWVDISLDGGATWAKLGAAGEGVNWYNDAFDNFWNGNSGLANEWITAEHLLDGAAGLSDVKIRFAFSSDLSLTNAGFGLDDISIREQAQLDLDMISFDAPGDGCSLGEEAITFTFWNKGLADVTGFDYGFSVNGGTAQLETSTTTVASGDTVTITYSTELVDLSAQGVYSIDVFTALVGDEDLNNDTLFAIEVENFGTSTPMYQSNTTATAIPDGDLNGVASEIFFCGLPENLDGCLEIESLTIDSLVHGWMSDIGLYLVSPAGDTVELSTNNGGTGDNMFNVVFSDTSSNDITLQTDGIADSTYRTEEVDGFASLYDGQNPNGGWSLVAVDNAGGFAGTLFAWSMTFVDNSPTPTLSYSDTTICLTQVLTVTAEPYDSWLWSTGNNSQSIDLFGDVLGLGTTEVFVTVDEGGCTAVSNSFILTVDACAGIAELGALSIDIYPNPSNGQIVIDVAGETDGLNISILDINGKLIQSEQIGKVTTGVRKAIDLRNVSKGMYFIKLDDGKDAVTQKLVIQ
jgi:subtilisin-like proprotein convertase family protein